MAQDLSIGIRLTADGSAFVGTVKLSREELDKLGQTVEKTSTLTSQLSGAVKTLTASYAALKTVDYIKDAALLNARYETLGVSLTVVGHNVGRTRAEMDGFATALQQTGISMIESRQTLLQMAQANIDLSLATKLARVAQDAAVIGNINSSEAFNRLIHGIQSGQTDVLRMVGINVSAEQSFKKLADQLGKNVNRLTAVEKTTALANEVLNRGADIAGTYEAAMGTAGKQLNSMARYAEDLKVKVGEVFNETLAVAVNDFTVALKAANAELDKAGSSGTIDRVGSSLASAFRTVYETVVVLGANVAYVFSQIGNEIGGVAAQAAALARLDFKGAAFIGEEVRKDAEAARKAVDAFSDSVLKGSQKSVQAARLTEAADIAAAKAGAARSAARAAAEQKADLSNGKNSRGGTFIDQLKQEIEKVGQGEEAYLRLKAAQLGVRDAAGPLISKLIASKSAHEAEVSATKAYNDQLIRSEEAQIASRKTIDEFAQSKRELIDLIRLETSVLGQSSIAQKLTLEAARIDLEIKKQALQILPEYRDKYLEVAQVLRGEYLASLKDANEAARSFETGVATALEAYRDDATNTAAQTARVLGNGFRAAEDALVQFAKTGKLNFRDFAQSVITDLLRIQAQKTILSFIGGGNSGGGGVFGSILGLFGGGGFGAGAAASTAAGSLGTTAFSQQSLQLAAQVFHTGHGPGDSGFPVRSVSSAEFANAPRYHSGIGAGEQAAIIRRDESVLTPGQMRQLAPAGAAGGFVINQNVTINMTSSGDEQQDTAKLTQQLKTTMRQTVVDVLTKERRPGGMLQGLPS